MTTHELRILEKRHGLVDVARTTTGHRRYTIDDLVVFRLLELLQQLGFTNIAAARLAKMLNIDASASAVGTSIEASAHRVSVVGRRPWTSERVHHVVHGMVTHI